MKRIHTLFLIHGKISKKSKIVYRVRNGRQQCYILNHSTPNSPAQRARQSIFAQVSAIVNREFKDPARVAHWAIITAQANIPKYTARKAAYAHYATTVKAKIQAKSPNLKNIQPQTNTLINHPTSNQQIFNTISFISYFITYQYLKNKNSHQNRFCNSGSYETS